jgi:hypothetical protein
MINIITIIIILLSFVNITLGKEKINYYALTSPTTPHIFLVESWVKEIKKNEDINWQPGLGCGGRVAYEKDTGAKLVEFPTGQMWQSLDDGDAMCLVSLDDLQFVSMIEYTHEICVPMGSKIKNIQDILHSSNLTMSHSSRTALNKWALSMNKEYKTNIKPIVYPASGHAMMAAFSGDVEMAFVSSLVAAQHKNNGKARCIATTQLGKNNSLSLIFPKVNYLLNTHVNVFPLAAKNLTEQQIKHVKDGVRSALILVALPEGVTVTVADDMVSRKLIKQKVIDQVSNLYNVTKNLK